MSEDVTADEVGREVPAHGWKCFHCGDVFTDADEAAGHFGYEEFDKPGCIERVQPGEERGLLFALRKSETHVRELRIAIASEEFSEGQAFYEMLEVAIRSFKPFRSCRTLQDVFNVYDSMEGRALAAEEQLERELAA